MFRKIISVILTVAILITCFSVAAVAVEADTKLSAAKSESITAAKEDLIDVVFYISAVKDVQGVNATIAIPSTYIAYDADTPYDVNSELTSTTSYVNATSNAAYNFSLLFDPKKGQTFTKKTELIRFHTKATIVVKNQTVTYNVVELFDINYNDIAASSVTCEIEKADTTPTLESISVTAPTNTSYFVGDSFSRDGMKVTAKYSDNSTADVTNSAVVSQPDMNTPGTKPVTVSYGEKTASFNITVTTPEITDISVTSLPSKTSYFVYEQLDLSGMEVTAKYNNNSTEIVTNSVTCSNPDMTSPGKKTITVAYEGKSTSFDIEVKAITVTKLTLTSKPDKLSYYTGDTFDPSGIRVVASYSDNTTKDITESVTITQPDMSTAGVKNIIVSYGDTSVSFDITVNELTLKNIAIVFQPTKTKYYPGEVFDTSGIKVTAIYSDNSVKDVTDSVTYSSPDMTTPGTKTVTVFYEGMSLTFDITVMQAEVTGIEVTALPYKTNYFAGEVFSSNGCDITASFSDGTTRIVTDSAIFSEPDMSMAGAKDVTVTYGGCSTNFGINVTEATVIGISITSLPYRTEYLVGEEFSTNGIVVTAALNNGTSIDVTNSVTYTTPDMSTAGAKDITVTYGGYSTNYSINVTEPVNTIERIDFNPPAKTSYATGEQLDVDSMSVTVYYSDGTSEIVTDKAVVTGFDSSTAGTKNVTVTYNGSEWTFTVYVEEIRAVALELTAPLKTEYKQGETLDLTGFTVIAEFSDGTKADVTQQSEISGFDGNTVGAVYITVTYAALSTGFSVNVTENISEIAVGDADGDGRITTKDSLIILRYSIGLHKNASAEQIAAMDADGNGKITAADALRVQRYAIGIVKTLR